MSTAETLTESPLGGRHCWPLPIRSVIIDPDATVYDGDLCLREVPGQGRVVRRVRQLEGAVYLEDPEHAGDRPPVVIKEGAVAAARVVGVILD